jgi:hypothetical protein
MSTTSSNTMRRKVCAQCGLYNIPERQSCKRCATMLSGSIQEVNSDSHLPRRRFIIPYRIFIPLVPFYCILMSFLYRPTSEYRGFTIEETISRANRVIAIDKSDNPSYRWVFTTPEDYIRVGDTGAIPQHDPAQISYGTGWTEPPQMWSNSKYTNLSNEEWQRVDSWRKDWCQNPPVLKPLKQGDTYYVVALRCRGYNASTFQVPKDQLTTEIVELLERSSIP